MPEIDVPRALVFRPLVKGNEALGMRMVGTVELLPFSRQSCAEDLISIKMLVSCLYLACFTVLACSPTGLSSLQLSRS